MLHVVKSAARDKVSVKTYFMSHPMSTVASITVSAAIAFAMFRTGDTSPMSYIGAAYAAESLINRFDSQVSTDGQSATTAS